MIHIEHVTSEASAKGEENWFPGWRAERYRATIKSHRRPEDSDLPVPVWLDVEPPSHRWPNVALRFFLGSVEVQTSTGSIVGGPRDWPRLGVGIDTPGGYKSRRYVDVRGTDPTGVKPDYYIQVDKVAKSGMPVSREYKAYRDIGSSLANDGILDFWGYNASAPNIPLGADDGE